MYVKDTLFVHDNIHDDIDYTDICKNMQILCHIIICM